MLAPPWIPVPPPGYGGIESVVAMLSAELVRLGHQVTLFAAPGSRSPAAVQPLLERTYSEEIGWTMPEIDHVARAFSAVEQAARDGRPYDVIHDHCEFSTLAMADRVATPVVHTLHGPFTPRTSAFYARHAHKAHLVAISRAQLQGAPRGLGVAGVVHNPIDAVAWPLVSDKDPYLLWVGRMTEEKGPHRAIAAARKADLPLILAGPVQSGQEEFFAQRVEPHIDGQRVLYVGEISGKVKRRLFSRARALLMPIRWPEPFGMVMLEAMVCGTPVVAFPEGAARELVTLETGLLVADEREMAAACARVATFDPVRCRAAAVDRCDVRCVARAYERVYRAVEEQDALDETDREAAGPAGRRAAVTVGRGPVGHGAAVAAQRELQPEQARSIERDQGRRGLRGEARAGLVAGQDHRVG